MKKKKLLLIVPRDIFLDSDRVMPPLGAMTLSSVIRECGWDTEIEIDFKHSGANERYAEYDVFAISCTTPQYSEASGIAATLKTHFPQKEVILGGPHATHYPEIVIANKNIDRVVIGEGEIAIREILSGRDTGPVVQYAVLVSEINKQPLPLREAKFLSNYHYEVGGKRASTILTARGCPMSCSFCESANSPVKVYTPAYVGRQIQQLKDLGYEAVMFFDDIFAMSEKRVEKLTHEIAKHNIIYRCFGHARTMTENMVHMLRDSGCVEVGFGAESGSQKILDEINKKTTVKQNMDFVDMITTNGMGVKAFLMIGLPGEDDQTVEETRRFIEYLMNRNAKVDFDLCIYYPYKGTAIRRRMDAKDPTCDLNFVKMPFGDKYWIDKMSLGFYKGRCGVNPSSVETSALSLHDLQSYQRQLLRYKRGAKI